MAKGRGNGFDVGNLEHCINNTYRRKTGMSPNPDHLSLMAREAREHGMSYGQYIAAYHPTNSPRHSDDPSEDGMGGKICPTCGKRFFPLNSQRVYCCEACRYQAYHDNKRAGTGPGPNRIRVEVTFADGHKQMYDSMGAAEEDLFLSKGKIARALSKDGRIGDLVVRKLPKESAWPTEEDPEPASLIPGIICED